MTVYYVGDERYFRLSEAKKVMKATGQSGFKYKWYANGDWIPCGEITLKGSNKSFIANTRMKKANY
jgi:hypothetical protein